MKISYRKNNIWGSITLFLNDLSNLDNVISNKLKDKYETKMTFLSSD
jgi:hypothetical protein